LSYGTGSQSMQNTPLQDAIDELLALNQFGRHAEMEARAGALLKSFPGVPVVRELLGIALAAQQRFADALPHFERAVRDDPSDPFFWDNLAFCQLQLGDIEATEATLREATARHPGSLSAWGALANVLFSRDRHDEARDVLGRILALQPGDPLSHFLLGRIAASELQFADAEQHFRTALAADPNVGTVHNELGIVQLESGDLRAAEASFRNALTLDPTDVNASANLDRVLSLLSQ
jgi:protein O-GlcNAc transferase